MKIIYHSDNYSNILFADFVWKLSKSCGGMVYDGTYRYEIIKIVEEESVHRYIVPDWFKR